VNIPKHSNIKGVIFDLDNTLVDFTVMKEAAVEAAALAMMDAGLQLSIDEIKLKIYGVYEIEGIEFQNVFDEVLHEITGKVEPKILAAGIVAYRRAREAMLVPYPHARNTLVTLIRMGLKTAVVSDAPALQAWLRLRYLQLDDLFNTVVTFDDTGERKPSPKPFLLALNILGLEAAETVMLGDWIERDIVGAKKIGMKTVHARYGEGADKKKYPRIADAAIDDIGDLVDIVMKWNTKDIL